MELYEDCAMLDWETMLELDEALTRWFLQDPLQGKWAWEWAWVATELQDPGCDSEEIPAVS